LFYKKTYDAYQALRYHQCYDTIQKIATNSYTSTAKVFVKQALNDVNFAPKMAADKITSNLVRLFSKNNRVTPTSSLTLNMYVMAAFFFTITALSQLLISKKLQKPVKQNVKKMFSYLMHEFYTVWNQLTFKSDYKIYLVSSLYTSVGAKTAENILEAQKLVDDQTETLDSVTNIPEFADFIEAAQTTEDQGKIHKKLQKLLAKIDFQGAVETVKETTSPVWKFFRDISFRKKATASPPFDSDASDDSS
jgi:hypothetical protein